MDPDLGKTRPPLFPLTWGHHNPCAAVAASPVGASGERLWVRAGRADGRLTHPSCSCQYSEHLVAPVSGLSRDGTRILPDSSRSSLPCSCPEPPSPLSPDLNSQCLLHVNGTLSGWKCESCQEHWAPSCLSEIHYQVGIRQRLVLLCCPGRRVMNNRNSTGQRQTQLAGRVSPASLALSSV